MYCKTINPLINNVSTLVHVFTELECFINFFVLMNLCIFDFSNSDSFQSPWQLKKDTTENNGSQEFSSSLPKDFEKTNIELEKESAIPLLNK